MRVSTVVVIVLAIAGAAAGATTQTGTLVSITRSGGLTAKGDTMTLAKSGAAQATTGPFHVSASHMARIRTLLKQARFSTLAAEYLPTDPITDGYTTRVTYGRKTVTIGQGAKPPARLQRLVDLLLNVLGRRG